MHVCGECHEAFEVELREGGRGSAHCCPGCRVILRERRKEVNNQRYHRWYSKHRAGHHAEDIRA